MANLAFKHYFDWPMYSYICEISALFGAYLLVRAPFAQTLEEVDRPSGPSLRGLGSIRAACCAWRALKSFFSAGVDKTISRAIMRRYLVPGTNILHFSECLCFLLIRISLKTETARLATTLGSLCRARFGVHFIEVCARCVPCAVCHACMYRVCNAMLFFFPPLKQQPAGRNCLGATFELRTRIRAVASVPLFALFSFSHLFF